MRRALLVLWLVGCGGAPAPAPAAPVAEPVTQVGEDPEAYAAVSAFFTKKRPHVSQCYANAKQDGKIGDKAKGYVALSMTVQPSGKPQDVAVSKTTLNAPAVESCIVALVSKWTLPQPSQPIAFTFTYDFKPE